MDCDSILSLIRVIEHSRQSTVYCKLFEVEKFCGWTRYFKFAGKLSRFICPGQNVLTCIDYAISLIECICLIIPNNYIYHLTCRFLTLADMAKQCGCKIVSSWKSQCSLSYSYGNADAWRANCVDT